MPRFRPFMMLLLLLAGCASAKTHYYVLDAHAPNARHKADTSIIALQLSIPRYLDRSQLVSRTEGHELFIAENHQWAGSLHENMARVLADDLSGLLSCRVLPMPLHADLRADATLLVDIHRFERMADGHIRLEAVWHVLKHGQRLHAGALALDSEQAIAGNDYAGIANGMNRLLDRMARDIADRLERMHHPAH